MTKIPKKTFLILLPASIWGLISSVFLGFASFASSMGGCDTNQITWVVNCNEPLGTLQLLTIGLPASIVSTFFGIIRTITGDTIYFLLENTGFYAVLFLVLTMLLSYFIIFFFIRLISFFKLLDQFDSKR